MFNKNEKIAKNVKLFNQLSVSRKKKMNIEN